MKLSLNIIDTFKAVLARLLYIIHGMLAVWRVTEMKSDDTYWTLSIPLELLIIEMFITLKFTKGEWKWFSPSTFLYLCCVVPSIWVMEEEFVARRVSIDEESGVDTCSDDDVSVNARLLGNITDVEVPMWSSLNDKAAVLAIEQLMLFLLVLGRWFMPAGNITRDQLSQLLLVYIGMAADIMEFSLEGVKEPAVQCSHALLTGVLALWSLSLLQFTLLYPSAETKEGEEGKDGACTFNTELWEISTAALMQDLPFLLMRLILLIHYNSVNQMMIFFICKNCLVLALHGYRFAIIVHNIYKERKVGSHGDEESDVTEIKDEESDVTKLKSLD